MYRDKIAIYKTAAVRAATFENIDLMIGMWKKILGKGPRFNRKPDRVVGINGSFT